MVFNVESRKHILSRDYRAMLLLCLAMERYKSVHTLRPDLNEYLSIPVVAKRPTIYS